MKVSFLKKLMHLLICILICFCVLGFTQMVKLQAEVPVGDPYQQLAEDRSMVLLDEAPSLAVSETVLAEQAEFEPLDRQEYEPPQEEQNEQEQQEEQQEEQQDSSFDSNTEQDNDTAPEDTPEGQQDNEKDGKDDGGEQNPDGDGGGDGDNGTQTPVETDITYFTTSIIDGETVTESAYSFTVTHTEEIQRQELTPYALEILLNGETVPQFNGTVLLEDGPNEIMVRAVYQEKNGGLKTVAKAYTVYLNREGIAITETIHLLGGRPVYKSAYDFEAYATLAGENVPLTVTVNGGEISGADGHYTAMLQQGSNIIELYSSYQGYASDILRYEVIYDTDLFEHNLQDQEINTPGFEFFANLKSGVELSSAGRYAVMLNGKAITNDTGSYLVELEPHRNTITLRAVDEPNGISYEQSFTIIYTPQEGDNAPSITTSLDSGNVDFKSKRHLLSVEAYSYTGQQIYATGKNGSGITVVLNGQIISPASSNTTYDLYFIAGENTVTVTAQDEEGYYATKEYQVYCDAAAEGEKIGTVTISVEASTVGLGYLIAPTQVDIYEGENAVYPLARLLDANGFEYNYSGNADNGFYLAHLLKGGITNGAQIPEDLMSYLESAGIGYNDYRTNSLGEHDFTVASGWVYQIDGTVPQYGLSECYLQDGQTLRLRFTLAQGRDVGCGGGNNFDGEW